MQLAASYQKSIADEIQKTLEQWLAFKKEKEAKAQRQLKEIDDNTDALFEAWKKERIEKFEKRNTEGKFKLPERSQEEWLIRRRNQIQEELQFALTEELDEVSRRSKKDTLSEAFWKRLQDLLNKHRVTDLNFLNQLEYAALLDELLPNKKTVMPCVDTQKDLEKKLDEYVTMTVKQHIDTLRKNVWNQCSGDNRWGAIATEEMRHDAMFFAPDYRLIHAIRLFNQSKFEEAIKTLDIDLSQYKERTTTFSGWAPPTKEWNAVIGFHYWDLYIRCILGIEKVSELTPEVITRHREFFQAVRNCLKSGYRFYKYVDPLLSSDPLLRSDSFLAKMNKDITQMLPLCP